MIISIPCVQKLNWYCSLSKNPLIRGLSPDLWFNSRENPLSYWPADNHYPLPNQTSRIYLVLWAVWKHQQECVTIIKLEIHVAVTDNFLQYKRDCSHKMFHCRNIDVILTLWVALVLKSLTILNTTSGVGFFLVLHDVIVLWDLIATA